MKKNENYYAGLKTLETLNSKSVPFMQSLGDLGDYVIEFGLGEILEREALSLIEREKLTIAILTALGGREPQLELHLEAALEIGIEPKIIEEIIIQTVPYAGFPTAINAMSLFNKILENKT